MFKITCLECRKEINISRTRRIKTAKFCSKKCYWKYRKEHPEEYSGEKHWNWKGGISEKYHLLRNTAEYKAWRDAVFRRDYWTCQECGERKYINAHHIKSVRTHPELMYDVDNGITMCDKCHKELHPEIGMKSRFDKENIPHNKKELPDRKKLWKLYVKDKKGSPKIGKIYGVSHKTILKWLDFYDIPRRRDKKHYTGDIPSKEELQKLYIEGLWGVKAIAEKYGVDISTISNWLKRHQISTRPFQGRKK